MRSGDVIAGRFQIDREIAAGGMGRVYRARDALTGREIALKVVRTPDGEPDPRFEREAAVLADIQHPAIVRYVAHGHTQDGAPFLAMEWLDGEDLADRIRRRRQATTLDPRASKKTSASLETTEIVVLARRIASGLAALHERGLVHRDVKPSNVFLADGAASKAKLLDFGLARHTDGTHALTSTGIPIGTPLYMAPEQARGAREIDARADVWALGCLLFECFTGTTPFRGQHTMAILAKVLVDPAPRLSDVAAGVPPELDALVARMLEKIPDKRPSDGAEVARTLAGIDTSELEGAPDRNHPASSPSLSLGTTEQRVFSVLVAGRSEGKDARVDEALRAYGGRREMLADGSLLVLFEGARVAGDQAHRAARTALALRALTATTPLAIATGRAEARAPHAVGTLLDRAVATLATATDGRIRLDAATADLLEGRFDLAREGGDTFLRALAEHRTRTLLGKPSPWVGREREIAMLEGVFAESVAEPMARAVLVTAPAGAGKSRLRHELIERCRRAAPVEVFFAQGDSLSAGSPFVMIAPAIRRSADILDGEPIDVRREKIRARVARHVPEHERTRVTEFLGELAQAPFPDDDREALRAARRDPMLMGDAMRSAFETFLLAECSAAPVIFVLEDLHWGDLPSVKFVDAALRTLRDRPFFVLAIARPEVSQSFPSLWSERALIEVKLDALTKKASERLVRAVLGDGVPAKTIDLVVERAEGNAFFLEEMIRAVATSGTVDLPDTVLGTLQARLDALGADAKRVLRAGSVFGEVFWRGGAEALVGDAGVTSTGEWLDDLVAREIVARRATSRIPGEDELAFRHALVRDAAYAMLTDDDRSLGHRLAAEWLEARGEVDALVLAEHWDRGKTPARALGWFRKAAEQALEGNDLAAAIERAERAVACNASGEELGALRALQATACYWKSSYADAQEYARAAAGLVACGSATWFRSLGEAIVASARRGDAENVDHFLAMARSASAHADALGAQIVCLCRGAFQLVFAGRFENADALLDDIGYFAGDVGALEPAVAAQVHHVRGVRAAHAGHVGDFMDHLERAIASFEQAGDTRNVALERPTLGWCYAELGDFERAESTLRAAVDACERMGVLQTKTYALVNLGYALALRSACAGSGADPRWIAEARAVQRDAAERCRAQGNPRLEGWSRAHLSTLELGAGNVEAARIEAERAVALLGASPGLEAWACAALARALLRGGDAASALPLSEKAYEAVRRLGSVLQCESLVPLVRAEALAAVGEAVERAEVIAYATKRLAERAERLAPRLREGFLSLPDNVATRALADHSA